MISYVIETLTTITCYWILDKFHMFLGANRHKELAHKLLFVYDNILHTYIQLKTGKLLLYPKDSKLCNGSCLICFESFFCFFHLSSPRQDFFLLQIQTHCYIHHYSHWNLLPDCFHHSNHLVLYHLYQSDLHHSNHHPKLKKRRVKPYAGFVIIQTQFWKAFEFMSELH